MNDYVYARGIRMWGSQVFQDSTMTEDIAGTLLTGSEKNMVIQGTQDGLPIKNNTKLGYTLAKPGDGIDISGRMEYHRGTVQPQLSPTLKTGIEIGVVLDASEIPQLSKEMIGGDTVLIGTLDDGHSQRMNVYDPDDAAPTLTAGAGMGGGLVPLVPQRLGNIYGFDGGNFAGNVYDKSGVCPTITTGRGGSREPLVIEQQPISTKGTNLEVSKTILAGYERTNMTGFNDDNAVLVESQFDPKIVASRGRDSENPSDGTQLEQRLEVQSEGLANTLTSVTKDNMVLEPLVKHQQDMVQLESGVSRTLFAGSHGNADTYTKTVVSVPEPQLVGGIGEKTSNGGTQFYQQDRVYDSNEVAMAHPAQIPDGSYKYLVGYAIRKLTPKECFRLMGVHDEDYEKLTASNTQKYKQAGNSIVVDCLMAIFENMFIKECKSSSLF